MTDNGQQQNEDGKGQTSPDELRIRSEHRQALAKIESEREAELARLDLEATRRMPIAIRLFFDDRLYQRATAMAERMAEAQGITPPHLLGKPGACFAVVSKSLAWNLDPFSVAQSTYEVHGRVAYEGKLVQAVLEASGKLEGGIRAEYIGDWSRVDGKFRIDGNKPMKLWTDADEQGLGITLRCKIRGEDEAREFTFYLRQCYPRNASTWPTRPRQMMHYNAVRAFANTAVPSLLLGVPFRDELDDEPPSIRDVTPTPPERPRQPLAPPQYETVYSAHGEEFQILPGELDAWAADQIRGAASGDELDALVENNRGSMWTESLIQAKVARMAEANRSTAERAGPPTERARKPGRPKKPETVARDIIAEIGATEPDDVAALLQTHAAAIGELPDELRTEVVTAAQDRQEDASPFLDEDEMSVDPIIDEPPISDEPSENDAYTRWVMEVREQARGCPTAGHITAYRKGRLAECAAWEDPEDATQQVMDAFDARMRQLTGAGVGR